MRRIAIVTVARSDYGILRPVLRAVRDHPALTLQLIVGGAHWDATLGATVREIEADGFDVADRVPMPLASDSPEAIAAAAGAGVAGYAAAFARTRPDLLVLMGDRIEMLAAAMAALPFNIPVAHIHGGESSEGAIDDSIRHAITKLSHLHFVALAEYRDRVLQLGEAPTRVVVTGAPGLDNFASAIPMSAEEFGRTFGFPPPDGALLITYHPESIGYEAATTDFAEVLAAIAASDRPALFTYPGADAGHRGIVAMIHEFTSARANAVAVPSLGTRGYLTMMQRASAMVGNSSSGIIEAATFRLPVVNIGKRQRGRVHGRNVLAAPADRTQILAAIQRATSHEFRESLADLTNPYGDGHAAQRIVEQIATVALGPALLEKSFCEVRR